VPRRRFLWWIVLVLFLGFGVTLGGIVLWAWYQFRAGESALDRYHAEEALHYLERYLWLNPNSVQAHLLAGRAARRMGDLEGAEAHLRTCRRLYPDKSDEIALEWALLRVTLGDLDENEAYLLERGTRSRRDAALVLEALAEGYTRLYRITDALRCLERWLEQEPDNVQAVFLRGNLWWQIQVPHRGVPDYQRVLEIDPERHEARWRLARCLVEGGGYDQALPLLEQTLNHRPGDPEALVLLARCEHMLGQPERARERLDGVLRDHPDHALALRTRGQLALLSGQPAEAEEWLRRGVAVAPTDYQVSWFLAEALEQQGKSTEAQVQREQANKWRDRRARLGQILSRLMAEKPHDPALHAELGGLLIELGNAREGEGWLLSALHLDPGYRPAHAALAEYYQKQGDEERAQWHRRQGGERR
jgi:predicted Zn-dependent protease